MSARPKRTSFSLKQQYDRAAALAAKSFMSKQQLDENTASMHKAEAALDLARAIDARDKAGPTKEERESADANVLLAEAARADLEAQLDKTKLLAPVDGVVRLLVAQPGEIIAPGQSVMTMTTGAERWFTFTVREDRLRGITIGSKEKIVTADGKALEGRVTEMRPLGEFATWRAARAVGDHDLNSFLLRVDPLAPASRAGAGHDRVARTSRVTTQVAEFDGVGGYPLPPCGGGLGWGDSRALSDKRPILQMDRTARPPSLALPHKGGRGSAASYQID